MEDAAESSTFVGSKAIMEGEFSTHSDQENNLELHISIATDANAWMQSAFCW
jgi:hypothetical protein